MTNALTSDRTARLKGTPTLPSQPPPAPPTGPPTSLDLDAIVAAGWLNPGDVPDDEFAAAQRFWLQRRRGDASLAVAAESTAAQIRNWTGHIAHDLGSYAVGLRLPSSDLDLGLSHGGDPDAVHAALTALSHHLGEVRARSGGTGSAYSWSWQAVDVNVRVLTDDGLAAELQLLNRVRDGLTSDETVLYLWIKWLIYLKRDPDLYDAWTNCLYQHYPHSPSTVVEPNSAVSHPGPAGLSAKAER